MIRPTDQEVAVTADRVCYTHRKEHAMGHLGKHQGWLPVRGKRETGQKFSICGSIKRNIQG